MIESLTRLLFSPERSLAGTAPNSGRGTVEIEIGETAAG
jgi:hypothetical protein